MPSLSSPFWVFGKTGSSAALMTKLLHPLLSSLPSTVSISGLPSRSPHLPHEKYRAPKTLLGIALEGGSNGEDSLPHDAQGRPLAPLPCPSRLPLAFALEAQRMVGTQVREVWWSQRECGRSPDPGVRRGPRGPGGHRVTREEGGAGMAVTWRSSGQRPSVRSGSGASVNTSHACVLPPSPTPCCILA